MRIHWSGFDVFKKKLGILNGGDGAARIGLFEEHDRRRELKSQSKTNWEDNSEISSFRLFRKNIRFFSRRMDVIWTYYFIISSNIFQT
jgi:hypothetical protein